MTQRTMLPKTPKSFKELEPLVMDCLEKNLQTRHNNMELILRIWTDYQKIEIPLEVQKALKKYALHPETLTRIKRDIQKRRPDLAGRDIENKYLSNLW